MEEVSFKCGMEERGSDGWCDGGDINALTKLL